MDTLSLYKNQLEKVPDELGDLRSLTTLELRQNQLAALPATLGKLMALETAHFSRNALTSVPAELGQLAGNLKKLELKKNPGLKTVPAAIGRLMDAGVEAGVCWSTLIHSPLTPSHTHFKPPPSLWFFFSFIEHRQCLTTCTYNSFYIPQSKRLLLIDLKWSE